MLNLFKRVVTNVSNVAEVHEELAIATTLVAASFATQRLITISPLLDRPHRCALAVMGIALTGDGKSSAEKILMSEVRHFEQERSESYEDDLAEYELANDIYQTKKKYLLREFVRAQAMDDDAEELKEALAELYAEHPQKPTKFRCIFENVTPAALAEFLAINPYVMVSSHEGTNTTAPGRLLSDPGMLNSGYDGAPYARDRVNGGKNSIASILITSFIMIQPEPFDELIKKKGEYLRGIGLLTRTLMLRPPSPIGSRTFDKPGDPDAQREFDKRMRECLEKAYARPGEPEPAVVEMILDRSAQSKWDRYREDAEAGSRPKFWGGQPDTYLARTPQNVARIAGVVAYFFEKTNIVSGEVMDFAIRLMKQFIQNYQDIFFPPQPSEVEQKLKVMTDWLDGQLREHPEMTKIPIAVIQNRGPNELRKAHICRPLLEILQGQGHLWFGKEFVPTTNAKFGRIRLTEFVYFASRNSRYMSYPYPPSGTDFDHDIAPNNLWLLLGSNFHLS